MFLTFSIESASLPQFLNHWSGRYSYRQPEEIKYNPYVGRPLTNEARAHLFEWKNGNPLSQAKMSSVLINYPINFEKSQLRERYLDASKGGGAIWNIFYMHCIDPVKWPIFDQHTFRAMHFIKTSEIKEIPGPKAEIFEIYERDYIPFVETLGPDRRKADKALFAFGRFLKMANAYY